MKKTIKHYNMDNLISQNCDFNIMFGERSNGKSYQLKHKRMILNYLKTGNRFILLRRFKEEITASNIEQYFQDVDVHSITDGKYNTISIWRKQIFLSNYNESGKIVRGEKIGYAVALSTEQNYAGGSFLDVSDIIFEEFMTRSVYLVNEPTKGLMQGPTQFGKGLAKGVTGLLNGVVGGTMDSVTKITGTLYTTVHGILGKKDALLMDNDEEDEPENLLVGATKGIKGGYQELKEGVTGFFINPFQRAQTSGAVGFIEGLSTGIFGLAISPFAFALRLGGSLAAGTKNTFSILYNKSLKNKRFRFPRYIEESKPLQNYDGDLSAAKEFLSKLVEVENSTILYFSSFICNNNGYKEKLAFLIVTNDIFLIISDKNKILLNIRINELRDIKLCYEKDNFIFIFELKNQKKKMINIDKSCVVVACHFYDILKDEINLLNEKKLIQS